MKECPPGKSRNPKTGRCVKDCPPESVRDPATGRCRMDPDRFRSELNAIIRQLRKPRLADDASSFKKISHESCLQSIPTDKLQQEIERRKKINVLIHRRKNK